MFLTGKREILHMCDKLRREFPVPRASRHGKAGGASNGSRLRGDDGRQGSAGDLVEDSQEEGHKV